MLKNSACRLRLMHLGSGSIHLMKKLQTPLIRIKLCGMVRVEDAALASALGADAIGMIFYAKSARNVSLSQAQKLVASVSPLCSTVAVVVNPLQAELEDILNNVRISMLQFHGDEPPEFCEQFQRPYMKAVRMRADTDLRALREKYASVSALLLDTFDKNLVGGTGRAFDWALLDAESMASNGPQIVLAGGLSPDNIVAAMRETGV